MKSPSSRSIDYRLLISEEIQGRLGRYRAPIRSAIRARLNEIAHDAGKRKSQRKGDEPGEPPLRFYVYEGYRVFYQLDSRTRRLVVLDLGRIAP